MDAPWAFRQTCRDGPYLPHLCLWLGVCAGGRVGRARGLKLYMYTLALPRLADDRGGGGVRAPPPPFFSTHPVSTPSPHTHTSTQDTSWFG